MNEKFEIRYLKRAIYVLNKIYELSGYDAYLVGGAVRDFLLNRSTSDFDVAINVESVDVFKDRFFRNEFKFLRYEKSYKAFKFIDKKTGLKFEFTPMRKEFYGKGNKPKIVFTDRPEIDYKRRDFTINALYMDRNEKILDFSNGISDLYNNKLRFIGDAEKRIHEDPRRIIRAIKFSESLNLKFDKETYNAIDKYFYLVKNINKEYRFKNFKKFILNQNPIFFNLICKEGLVYKNFYLSKIQDREQLIRNFLEKNYIKFDILVTALIIKMEITKLEVFLDFIGFTNKEILKIKSLVNFYISSEDFLDILVKILGKYGIDTLYDLYDVLNFIRFVWGLSDEESEKIDKLAKIIHNIERGLIPTSINEVDINGEDLMKIGFKGAQIGEILNELFEATLFGEKNENDHLINLAELSYKEIRR